MIKKNIRYLMLTAAMLLAGSSAWGYTYYLDFRDVNHSFFQKNWIQTQNSNDLIAEVDSPESGVITITTDFALGTTDATMIKYDVSFTGGNSQIQHIGSTCMGANNCIKVKSSGSYDFNGNPCDGASSLISFTTYTPSSTFDIEVEGTDCTIDPDGYTGVTSGSSVTFEVTPESGYTYSTATYSGGISGSITKSGDTFTFNPTSAGTFTVVYSLKYSVTPSVSGGTVSPSTTQTVEAGSYVDFTVTPTTEDHEFSSISYDGTGTAARQGETNVFRVTPTSSGTVSIVYVGHSAPQVCIGEKPRFSDCNLTVGAYVMQTGCDDITSFNLYYSNNSMFRSDGNYKTAYKNKDVSSSSPAINSNTNITLTSNEVEQVVKPGETLYLRVNATNGTLSEFSEVVPVMYECNRFVTSDTEVDFMACPGQHQFKLSDMFLSPEPTTWSAKLTEKGGSTVSPATDATADFSLVNGQMIWNTAEKDQTSYVYEFTAKKAGYSDGTATLTINYTVPGSLAAGGISRITADPTSTTPYEPVELLAEGTTGDIKQIEWTSVPASATFSDISGNTLDATATFRANKISSAMTYTVTVAGYDADCASSKASTTITVTPDTAEDCD